MYNQTRVIIVRHGRSTYNDQQRYQGCCDESVLTEQGKHQAFQTGIALSQINFDAIYASPLKRTQETAKEILRVTNSSAQLHLNSNLKEVDLPGWQGLEYKYVRQYLKQEYQNWEENPHEFTIETLESNGQTLVKTKTKPVLQLYEQARQFWQEILPRHQGKTVLVVSHGGTIRALLSTATQIQAHHYHAIQQSNSGISILDFENTASSNAKITAINLTQHLGEVLPKLKNGKHGLRLLLLPVNSHNTQTNDYTDKITQFLKNVELNFCLSNHIHDAESIVESIIESHSNTPVHLQVSRQDFLDTWHQQISKSSLDYNALNTSLIVADTNTISHTLSQILGLKSTTSLNINPGEITVLFYPTSQNKPVLQAMNINAAF
ncbi:MAG: histidine phosphatase family protein [Rivularia sp. T60_A2020_040]|nr:histidine phosphatase family protein [Rivularia sp. T60_A2020_040]